MGVTLFSRLPQIAAGMPGKAGAVVQKTTMDVQADAQNDAAVDTGYMRSSTHGRMTGPLSGEVVVGAAYGIFVEMGTYKMAAQPFLVPAAEKNRGPFLAAMKQAIVS